MSDIVAVFTAKGGYESEKVNAKKRLVVGQSYTVASADIGRSCTYIQLEEVDGSYNSCLFDVDFDLLYDTFGSDYD